MKTIYPNRIIVHASDSLLSNAEIIKKEYGSTDVYTISQCSKSLDITRQTLIKFLHAGLEHYEVIRDKKTGEGSSKDRIFLTKYQFVDYFKENEVYFDDVIAVEFPQKLLREEGSFSLPSPQEIKDAYGRTFPFENKRLHIVRKKVHFKDLASDQQLRLVEGLLKKAVPEDQWLIIEEAIENSLNKKKQLGQSKLTREERMRAMLDVTAPVCNSLYSISEMKELLNRSPTSIHMLRLLIPNFIFFVPGSSIALRRLRLAEAETLGGQYMMTYNLLQIIYKHAVIVSYMDEA